MPILLTASTLAVHLGTAGMVLSAQEPAPPPKGTITLDARGTPATHELGGGSFATAAQAEPDVTRATELDLALGGIFATGNARTTSFTGIARFRLRRRIHQFRAEAAGNYGQAALDAYSAPRTTVTNGQGLLRYDVFLHPRVSGFVQMVGRHDPFQGLLFRLNVDPGFAFYAITQPNHRLWFEVGYDFQYDIRTERARVPLDEAGVPILGAPLRDKIFINHAARMFSGYTNNLSEHVTFDTGVEYLQSLILGDVFRVNWMTSVTAQLASRVSLSTNFSLRYENRPVVPRKLDTITAVLLGVRFL